MNGHRPARGNPSREQNPAYGLLQPIIIAMTDNSVWKYALQNLEQRFAALPGASVLRLNRLFDDYCSAKAVMDRITRAAGSGPLCHDCGGQCCLNGKYRINGLDALVMIASGTPVPDPDFSRKPLCPYGHENGCSMEPRFRPASCVQFICEPLAALLPIAAETSLAHEERSLRELISRSESLSGLPLGLPLLLWGEQQLRGVPEPPGADII